MATAVENIKTIEPDKACKKPEDKISHQELTPVTVYSKIMLEKMTMKKAEPKCNDPLNNSETGSSMQYSIDGEETDEEILPGRVQINSALIHSPQKIKNMDLLGFFGIKLDLKSRIGNFMEMYRKNYALSKSHNYLIGKYAAMKLGFCTMMMSVLGVSPEEIMSLASECRRELKSQNKRQFEENEYTSELLEIVGGAKKKIKAERTVLAEIRKQLMSQMSNLGEKDYYSPQKTLEIQSGQCALIHDKMQDEQNLLEYQKIMLDSGIISDDFEAQLSQKLSKLTRFVNRAQSRLDMYDKKKMTVSTDRSAKKGLV